VRSPGTQGALSTLFVFYLLAFAAALLWAILSLPDLFPVFRWPYTWTAAFVRLVDYAIPVTVAGLAVAYSLFLRPAAGPRRPFHRAVSSQLTLLSPFPSCTLRPSSASIPVRARCSRSWSS
jgi:hypothetical protein